MVVVVGLAILILAVWALFNPLMGLIGLLGILFVRPGELYPVFDAIHVERVFSVIAMLSFLFHERRLLVPNVSKSLLRFWGSLFCTVPLSFWPGGAFQASLDFGKTIIYHLLIVNLATTLRRFKTLVTCLCLFICWLAGSSFYLYYTGDFAFKMGVDRARGVNALSEDPNALGITVVTALPLFLLLLKKDAGPIRWVMMPLTAMCMWTVILTGSRASTFTFVLMAMAYAFTRKRPGLCFVGIIVFLAALWVVMPEQYHRRLETIQALSQDESYQGRVQAWEAAWQMFKNNPLTGVGPTMFSDARGAESGHWKNVHSLYLEIIAELGLVGTVAFAAFLISIFRENRRLTRQLKAIRACPSWFREFPTACNLSLIGLLIAGYSSHSLFRDTWYFMAGLTSAASLVAKIEARKVEADKKDASAAIPPVLEPAEVGA